MNIKMLRQLIREELDDIYRQCPMCDGTGKGSAREGRNCPECNGSGHVLKKNIHEKSLHSLEPEGEFDTRGDEPHETRAAPIELGHLYAWIGSDRRYMDYLKLTYDSGNDTVTVTVSGTGAAGGMDTFNGATDPDEKYRKTSKPGPSAKDVMQLLKGPLTSGEFNFKEYGKPTKRFTWINDRKGLSLDLAARALEDVRASEGDEWDALNR